MSARRWFVAGASGGFGLAIARQVLERGDHVVATARRVEALRPLAQAHGTRLHAMVLDVTDFDRIPMVVEEAIAVAGPLDVFVNCTGYALAGAVEEVGVAQIRAQIDTNLVGAILLIRAVLAHLRAHGAGRIVQLSSEGGQMCFPALSLYHAGKWGIEGFCESLAKDVAPLGIHVTLVEPGRAATGFDAHVDAPQQIVSDYQRTTVGNHRRLHAMGKFPMIGDVEKMARAIIAEADAPVPRRRLVLGSDAWRAMHRALSERLRELEDQQGSAGETDRAGGVNRRPMA